MQKTRFFKFALERWSTVAPLEYILRIPPKSAYVIVLLEKSIVLLEKSIDLFLQVDRVWHSDISYGPSLFLKSMKQITMT